MIPDRTVPLKADSPGCSLETEPRNVQHQTNPEMYYISMNRDWLSQLGICAQSAPTVHSLATRPVEIQNPAIIIQPARVIDE